MSANETEMKQTLARCVRSEMAEASGDEAAWMAVPTSAFLSWSTFDRYFRLFSREEWTIRQIVEDMCEAGDEPQTIG